MNTLPGNPNPESQIPASKAEPDIAGATDDGAVERLFNFVRSTLLFAIFGGIGFLGWTAYVVNNGTGKMFDVTTTTEEMAMPAEGPDWAETFRVTEISLSSSPPTATVNGERVTEGELVSVPDQDGIIIARVIKIGAGTVELEYGAETKAVKLTPVQK